MSLRSYYSDECNFFTINVSAIREDVLSIVVLFVRESDDGVRDGVCGPSAPTNVVFCVGRVKVRARASNASISLPLHHHLSAPFTRTRLAVEPRSARRQLAHVCCVIVHRPATIRALGHFEFPSRHQRHRSHPDLALPRPILSPYHSR
jgi:hypothetical protein